MAWTALVKWGSQLLSWGAVVYLARVLTPADYGLVGLAAVYLALIGILTEGGLGTSIITLRQMSDDEVAQVHTVSALLGLAGTVLTAAAAIPLGAFFRSPELPPVVAVLGLNAFLSSLRVVPVAILQRQLRFRGLAMVDGIHAVTGTLATTGLAILGWRYWALVAGNLAANLVAAVVAGMMSHRRFARPRGSLGKYFGFTRDILVGRVAWFTYTNADFMVAGRMLGTAALGAYSFAWNIASTPVEKVTALVTRVTPGLFSRLQHDRAALTRYLLSLTEGLVFLTLPASIGLTVVADDFVLAYLGPQWVETILPLRILALYVTFRSVVTLLPQILTVLGQTRFLMINGLITAVVLPVSFVIGSRWGGAGIAAVWALVYPIRLIPLYRRTLRALSLSFGTYLRAVWPATRASLLMLLALLATRALLPPGLSSLGRLLGQVGVGAAVFLVLGVYPERDRLRHLVSLIRTPPPNPTKAPGS